MMDWQSAFKRKLDHVLLQDQSYFYRILESNIKESAISNTGKFDPNDPNITNWQKALTDNLNAIMNPFEVLKRNLLDINYKNQPRWPKGTPQGGRWKSEGTTGAKWENKTKGELRSSLNDLGIHSISTGPEAMMTGIKSDDMGNKIGAHFTDIHNSRPELKEFTDKLTKGYIDEEKGISRPPTELPTVFIKGTKEELGGGVIASYAPFQNQINMPGGIKSDPNELVIGKGQYNVGIKLETAIRHEYGHFLSQKVQSWGKWCDLYDKIGGKKAFAEKVSGYAATDYDEGFAESFAAWSHPKYKQAKTKLPKEVENYFDEIFNQNPRRQS